MPARGRGSNRLTEKDLTQNKAKSAPSRMSSAQYRAQKTTQTESEIQCALIRALGEIPYRGGFVVDYIYSIPNGGYRSKKTAGIMKAEGVKSGVPDLHLFAVCPPYHSLYIEMKTEKGSLSDSQEAIIPRLRQEGHKVVVCRSEKQAIEEILKYLGIGQ